MFRATCIIAFALLIRSELLAQSTHQLSAEELENLVAPVALYPDVVLDQVLDASQYPSALVSAGDFLSHHEKGQKPDASWPASVQALVDYPDVLSKLDDGLAWTTRLGNAVKADKQGVEAAIQTVRQKARAAGNLASTDQQKIVVQNNVIQINPATPDLVYVPEYNPAVIYAPHPAAAPLITFGAGVAVGAALEHNYDLNHYDYYHHHYYDHITQFHAGTLHSATYLYGGHAGVTTPYGHAGVTHVGGPVAGATHVGAWGPYGHGGATVGHVGSEYGGVSHHAAYGPYGGVHGGISGFHGNFYGGGFHHGGGFHIHGGFRR